MAEAGRFPPLNQTGAVRRRGRRAYGSDPNRYRGLRQPGARRGIRAAAEPGHGAGGRVYPTPALQPHTPDARRTRVSAGRPGRDGGRRRRAAALRRQRRRPSGAEPQVRRTLSPGGQLRHPREHSRPLCRRGRRGQGRREDGHHLRGVGSRPLFPGAGPGRGGAALRGELHLLGPGGQPGPLRRRPPYPRRPGRAAVHHPGPRRPGCGAQRRQSGADHPAEAHAGVLCGGGGGGRPGPHRAGDHHHAPLLCRLRHHGALSL